MSKKKGWRQHSPEFRISIAEGMLAGENVTKLSREHDLARSVMYRWRDAYRERGAAGLGGSRGHPAGVAVATSIFSKESSGVSKNCRKPARVAAKRLLGNPPGSAV